MTLPNGKVDSLIPLDMSKVTIWVDNVSIISPSYGVWYVYNDGYQEYKFTNDEVLHFKGLTPDGIQGMAIKDYLSTTIENLQYGSNYVNKYFKGGLSAKGLLQYTGDIDPNAMNRMKERFEKMATGMSNVGKILPVPLGFQLYNY
jgi:HK97 family phage portal protein